jgi:hypothetical protein
MRVAEVMKGAGLSKGVLINEACIAECPRLTVRIIRRTKLSIDGARHATGDAVAAGGPGPPHRVADRDVDRVRNKYEAALSHRYVEDLIANRWQAADCWPAVLIDDIDAVGGGLLFLRRRDASVSRFSLRRKYQRKGRCQQKSPRHYCIRWFHDLTLSPVRKRLWIFFSI